MQHPAWAHAISLSIWSHPLPPPCSEQGDSEECESGCRWYVPMRTLGHQYTKLKSY